jgi:DnaJ domain
VLASAVSEPLAISLSDAALLAALAMSPTLFVGYALYAMWARTTRSHFYLKNLELMELDRAVLLYERVSNRRKAILLEGEDDDLTLLARCRQRYRLRRQFADELEELQAYGLHLRSTIVRLRGKPIQRFKSWVHINCSKFAFSHSLGSYYLSLALLMIGQHFSEQPVWAQAAQAGLVNFLLDDRLLYANLMAAGVVAVVMPSLYFLRRAKLCREHRMQLRILQEFACADPETLVQQLRIDGAWCDDAPASAPRTAGEETWFDALGLSPSATIEEVKEAYRMRIKQNHPDRVQDMSPRFRELAEAETKKLNVAYDEALAWLRAT